MFQAIGDSMIEAGIVGGDLLFVIPTHELRDAAKHIVIFRVSGVTLAKHLELHAGPHPPAQSKPGTPPSMPMRITST